LTNQLKVALAVDTFLGYTNSWIYRQITGGPSGVSLALCHVRDCEEDFPFEPVVVSANRTHRLVRKIRGKLWPVFKHFPPRLTARQKQDFKQALQAYDIKLVHAHFATTGAQYAPLCRDMNIPLIITVHGFDITSAPKRWPAYEKALRMLWNQCPFFIVISREMGDRLAGLGCPEDRIRISYLGVPVDEFPFTDRSHRDGPVRFLHAGRLAEKKGVPDLVRAFADAFPEPGSALLEIVGDGEEKDEIQNTIRVLSPANPVKMTGRLSVEDLAYARERADVFVLNCRVDKHGTKEGLPISTLEAACTGLPTISTRHAGSPESILPGETGILVDEFDNESLSKAMLSFTDGDTRITMGRAARAYMEKKFEIEKCNQVLGNLYAEAIGTHSSGL